MTQEAILADEPLGDWVEGARVAHNIAYMEYQARRCFLDLAEIYGPKGAKRLVLEIIADEEARA